jgi:predicted outer membrane protein
MGAMRVENDMMQAAVPLGRGAATVLTLVAAALFTGAGPAAAAPAVPTQLNATDMALLNGVRLAGLWEMPAGQMAAERGNRDRVRQIGQMIADQHVELDELVVNAANKLGATLPATPNADQQGWLKEMQNATGGRFDQIFVDRLRAAHGKIFPTIGAVRAGTRNPVIRQLADRANIFVMNHMVLLESTGLVRYANLPPAAVPAAQDVSALALAQANAGGAPPVSPTVVWAVLLGTLTMAAFATVRVIGRGSRR